MAPRWLLAAATALAVVALAGCNADHGQRTSGVPPTASGPPATGRPAQHAYYAQAADFTGPERDHRSVMVSLVLVYAVVAALHSSSIVVGAA